MQVLREKIKCYSDNSLLQHVELPNHFLVIIAAAYT